MHMHMCLQMSELCLLFLLHAYAYYGPAKLRDSVVPIRFDSTVMGRFEKFRMGRVCPLLVVVRRLKPLTALSGTVYRLASSMSDHTPVL